jgi:integrase
MQDIQLNLSLVTNQSTNTTLALLPTDTQGIHQTAVQLIASSDAPATTKAKLSDINQFQQWLVLQNDATVDAGRIVEYLTYQYSTGKKYASLQRYKVHLLAHYDLDFNKVQLTALKDLMRGIARTIGTKQKQAHALTVDQLKAMLVLCDNKRNARLGIRDKAILAIGFSCALRVSEIVALTTTDIKRIDTTRGEVVIRSSKTDQSGKGYTIAVQQGVHIQALDAIDAHIKLSRVQEGGLLFDISEAMISRIIKAYAKELNLVGVSCHSLRSGFITAAIGAGATIDKVKAISRHKSTDILMGYIRESDKFKDNATARVL